MTEASTGTLIGARTAPRPPAAAVEKGGLHLWALHGPDRDDGPTTLPTAELDEDELTRAAAFVRPLDRLRYVTAHIALRRLLAAYTGVAPGELLLSRAPCSSCGGPHGRPVITGSPVPLNFSLSHSHGLAIIGISAATVGVDVERLPSPETTQMSLPALHPREQAELGRLPPHERPAAFGRLWTRKEAYLKGIGTGLTRDLGADYLGEDRGPGAPEGPPGWTVRNVPGHPGHVAAVAVPSHTEQCGTTRRLPLKSLYAEDADELIATVKERLCTSLPAADGTALGAASGV
ncbi:4'-phosphopantetheinyl transferase family protein [Streptomyces boluensis]|uniref:4'-phosphopantetheinyl transferase superfamily protein n=1 Tax=Streptomyces boluensis TaxID=1775135 RepID=A0A964UJ22_9ACTN|nr:4'-phosphopantetheinyl transferase superfamily protein [Streptomyces boluensis]NBE49916.1 4'-phosphopantetheinyl transferase superfamily protein [Streptomyces boluensis]